MRPLNNGTADIAQNLSNVSSTTHNPDLFSASPSAVQSESPQPSILSSASNTNRLSKKHSFRAAFGMNMRGSSFLQEGAMLEHTPKDRKCIALAPTVKGCANRFRRIESFSKPLY